MAKDDPWDAASGKSKNGHGVGMSQSGAEYAASIGVTYEDILAFYYVGTEIGRTACSPTSDTSASVGVAYSSDVTSDSAKDGVKMIKADELVDMFRIALS